MVARAEKALDEVHIVTLELGGTLSGEHGIGYVKAPYLGYAVDDATLAVMKGIKHTFDPNGILNPGKIFTL